VMTAHVSHPPPVPHQIVPELPKGVSEAILWMLEKDRERRPRTIELAITALDSAAKGRPFQRDMGSTIDERPIANLSAPRMSVMEHGSKRRTMAIGAGALSLVAAIAAGGILWTGSTARSAAQTGKSPPAQVAQAVPPAKPVEKTPQVADSVEINVRG